MVCRILIMFMLYYTILYYTIYHITDDTICYIIPDHNTLYYTILGCLRLCGLWGTRNVNLNHRRSPLPPKPSNQQRGVQHSVCVGVSAYTRLLSDIYMHIYVYIYIYFFLFFGFWLLLYYHCAQKVFIVSSGVTQQTNVYIFTYVYIAILK